MNDSSGGGSEGDEDGGRRTSGPRANTQDPVSWHEDPASWLAIGRLVSDAVGLGDANESGETPDDLDRYDPATGQTAQPSWSPMRFTLDPARKYSVLFFYCSRARGDVVCDCLLMRRTTFPHERLAPHLAAFEWYEMDVNSDEAAPFLEKYDIRRSPVFLVVDQAGCELLRLSGHKQAGELSDTLSELLAGMQGAQQRHERTLAQLTERLDAVRAALRDGDLKLALRWLQMMGRTARGGGYLQWEEEVQRGFDCVKGRLEGMLVDLERRATSDPEGVAREAKVFRKDYGGAFPDLARRASALGG